MATAQQEFASKQYVHGHYSSNLIEFALNVIVSTEPIGTKKKELIFLKTHTKY